MSAAPPVVLAEAVQELYASLLSSRRHARAQLSAMQEIERRHGHAPLAVLVDLALHGGLSPAGPEGSSGDGP